MFKPKFSRLATAVAFAMTAGVANAEIEVSGYVKNETAFFTDGGQLIGEERSTLDNSSHHGDVLKFENSARLFMNGEFGQESSWHLDLNLIYDSEGVESEFQGHQNYTQHDWLREAYIDTKWGDADIRIGKQQVVWGTADGIKLLDIINPTDFREFNQNTMEDSRIPIWMVNADIPVGESSSLQLILSEQEENKIPGLDKDGDNDHPFIVQGVDTITGRTNGFLNIAPALALSARSFANLSTNTLHHASAATVDHFVNNSANAAGFRPACSAGATGFAAGGGAASGSACLDHIANSANGGNAVNANNDVTNLIDSQSLSGAANSAGASAEWSVANPNSTFEYMPSATFATFNTFAGNAVHPSMVSRYVRDYPKDDQGNFGARLRGSLDNGLNYSFNYFYHYDSNPSVDISMHDAVTGEKLSTEYRQGATGAANVVGGTTVISTPQTARAFAANGANNITVLLRNGAGQAYGASNPAVTGASTVAVAAGATAYSANGVEMRLTETVERVHSLGGSLDYAFDTASAPIVFRAEALYDKDVRMPTIDRLLLSIGDLDNGLSVEKHDMFKYVLGVDVTVMTDLLVSTQFIQFRDLDYVDKKRTCSTSNGLAYDCSRYTGDAPTLHLTNDLNKAEKNKEFISLFFSKPFGSDQQGRWNNITIFEDTGGYWNRFDVEYGFTDELVGTAELNTYWGDENSWFGQLENSSSIQVGLKYIFD